MSASSTDRITVRSKTTNATQSVPRSWLKIYSDLEEVVEKSTAKAAEKTTDAGDGDGKSGK